MEFGELFQCCKLGVRLQLFLAVIEVYLDHNATNQ